MSTTYTYELSFTDMKKLEKDIANIKKIITSPKLLKFIADKCDKALEKICQDNLNSLEDGIESSAYMSAMHSELQKDSIYIYNDAVIDVSSKNVSDITKQNYPNGLSLAKVVEYGVGYTGSFTNAEVDDWEYDINEHGEKGWYYQDNAGNFHWTNGFEGRLIFLKLKLAIEQNVKDWIYEYVSNELG